MKTIRDLNIREKKVLLRVDYNVPLDASGQITDDTRIKASLPTIEYALKEGAALIVMSHLGRDPKLSLKPCAERLSQLIQRPVQMAPPGVGADVKALVEKLQPGQLLLLENLRYNKGEKKPEEEPTFVQTLASFGDCYVNDAFGAAHRKESSVYQIVPFFAERAAAGFLLEKEVKALTALLTNPSHPFLALIGGAKISTKLGVLQALLNKVDMLLIGGAMAYTFLQAMGVSIGKSLVEKECVPEAKEIMQAFAKKLVLPIDLVVTQEIKNNSPYKIVSVEEGIPDGWEGVDMGPKTIQLFSDKLKTAKTILWNGPVGVFEVPPFDKGTMAIAHLIATISATTVVGGGDSVSAVIKAGVADKISHLSTGGGASLELLEKGTLPGIEVLQRSR